MPLLENPSLGHRVHRQRGNKVLLSIFKTLSKHFTNSVADNANDHSGSAYISLHAPNTSSRPIVEAHVAHSIAEQTPITQNEPQKCTIPASKRPRFLSHDTSGEEHSMLLTSADGSQPSADDNSSEQSTEESSASTATDPTEDGNLIVQNQQTDTTGEPAISLSQKTYPLHGSRTQATSPAPSHSSLFHDESVYSAYNRQQPSEEPRQSISSAMGFNQDEAAASNDSTPSTELVACIARERATSGTVAFGQQQNEGGTGQSQNCSGHVGQIFAYDRGNFEYQATAGDALPQCASAYPAEDQNLAQVTDDEAAAQASQACEFTSETILSMPFSVEAQQTQNQLPTLAASYASNAGQAYTSHIAIPSAPRPPEQAHMSRKRPCISSHDSTVNELRSADDVTQFHPPEASEIPPSLPTLRSSYTEPSNAMPTRPVPPMEMWADSDDGVLYMDSSNSMPTRPVPPMGVWADSDNGRHLEYSTRTQEPLYSMLQ
ncbi:hypothetical protein ACJ73_09472 [Blastomyces percursus]|uniref:Uncharacterized protein n=1 Tax=Blastomyces percursus TaxID=1658174 RepID=A0A1J9P5U4_9EURO|nr:hypothetical protein ACJ73_09472 [Blastomyces percursus]